MMGQFDSFYDCYRFIQQYNMPSADSVKCNIGFEGSEPEGFSCALKVATFCPLFFAVLV